MRGKQEFGKKTAIEKEGFNLICKKLMICVDL